MVLSVPMVLRKTRYQPGPAKWVRAPPQPGALGPASGSETPVGDQATEHSHPRPVGEEQKDDMSKRKNESEYTSICRDCGAPVLAATTDPELKVRMQVRCGKCQYKHNRLIAHRNTKARLLANLRAQRDASASCEHDPNREI